MENTISLESDQRSELIWNLLSIIPIKPLIIVEIQQQIYVFNSTIPD